MKGQSKKLKVLLVYKESAYKLYFSSGKKTAKPMTPYAKKNMELLKAADKTHYETLNTVKNFLNKNSFSFLALPRGIRGKTSGYDLIVAVGGDGTFMEASRQYQGISVLGINSDPNHSIGKYCCANVNNFESALKAFHANKAVVEKLRSLEITLGKRAIEKPVLNDVLVCHQNPAAMSHYVIEIGGGREHQRSSGVWISTPSGSSAAIHSAGGVTLRQGENAYLYQPRELYEGGRFQYKLRGGVLAETSTVIVESLMPDGAVFIDGSHIQYPFIYGEKLLVRMSDKNLLAVKEWR